MSLPTLLVKGNLLDPVTKTPYHTDEIPIKFILNKMTEMFNKTGIENRVLFVDSKTGSGKSTALPVAVYDTFILNKGETRKGIICTQPRVLTTKDIVQEIVSVPVYSHIKLGQEIGFSTKYSKLLPEKRYSILISTIGTLKMILMNNTDEFILSKYKAILIDEIHERDIETDITLMYIKQLLLRQANNLDCPMLLMLTGTIEHPQTYLEYFNCSTKNNLVIVTGFSHKKILKYAPSPVQDMAKSIMTIIEYILYNENDEENRGDILTFIFSSKLNKEVTRLLEKLNARLYKEKKLAFILINLKGENEFADQTKGKALLRINLKDYDIDIDMDGKHKRVRGAVRRIILSNVVAETGLTIGGLKYCIDTGYFRTKIYLPNYRAECLYTIPATESRLLQRMGRVGRKFDGKYYALFTENDKNLLQKQQFPNIMITNIDVLLLQIMKAQQDLYGHFLFEKMDMLDLPPHDSIADSFEKLYTLNMIDPFGEGIKLTKQGEYAVVLNNLNVEDVAMIMCAYLYRRISFMDLLSIVVYTQTELKTDFPKYSKNKNIVKRIVYDKVLARVLVDYYKYDTAIIISLIGDDFIFGIFLVTYIQLYLNDIANKVPYTEAVEKWLRPANIPIDYAMNLVARREEAIFNLIENRMVDITKDVKSCLINYKLVLSEFYEYIGDIKRCLFEGYKLNILFHDGISYKTRHGQMEVSMPAYLDDIVATTETPNSGPTKIAVYNKYPKYLIYDKLTLIEATHGIYKFKVSNISILDGYIDFDLRGIYFKDKINT